MTEEEMVSQGGWQSFDLSQTDAQVRTN